MATDLEPNQARRLRLRSQALHPRAARPSAALVRRLVGVQAQELPSANLALRVRSGGLVEEEVDRSREATRDLVRTWSLRGTLHLHHAADLGWLLPLLGPPAIRKSQRRFAELGLSEAIFAQARPALEAVLAAGGPQTRPELAIRLADKGIPTEGQGAYHLLRRAGLEGWLCYGPDRDGEPTFVLLETWADPGEHPDPETALARLARRYLAGYGPARPEDLAAWSGLSLAAARAGFESLAGELLTVVWNGEDHALLKEQLDWLTDPSPAETPVTLLPGYDPYLLGYRGRDLIVAPEHARRIHPGGGLLRPTLLVGGRAAGTWKRRRRTHDLVIQVTPFAALDPRVLPALEAEVKALGHFLQTATVLLLEKPEARK